MIQKITMRGVKAANEVQELTGRDIFIGKNGSGKTTRLQSIGIAMAGYAPGGGKMPSETIKLARGDHMAVGVETEDFSVIREFKKSGARAEQKIMLFPPNGDDKTAADMERSIEQKLGKCPVMFDFNEFLALSDMKRREYIYALAGGPGAPRGDQYVYDTLKGLVTLPETADPEQIKELQRDIDECAFNALEAYGADVGTAYQQRLQAMVDYAKEQASLWRKERDKAAGASQKISEYKNELDETDRTLDSNNKKLEGLGAELKNVDAGLAMATEENKRLLNNNKRIAAVAAEINSIEQSQKGGDAESMRALIEQYRGDIKQVDNQVEILALTAKKQQAAADRVDIEKDVSDLLMAYQDLKYKKSAHEGLIAKVSAHDGQCAIDCRIECNKDFSGLIVTLKKEIKETEDELFNVKKQGEAARAFSDETLRIAETAQHEIDRLREEEIDALRDNDSIKAAIREIEDDIAKIENFDSEKTALLAAKRGELKAISPDGGGEWQLADVTPLASQKQGLEAAIRELGQKITEQTRVRNTLINLKASMIDLTVAGWRADNWKRIAEVLGPKGLQGELVKDALAPITEAVQAKLAQMNIHKSFYIQTEDDKGKELFQFGWSDITQGDDKPSGERRNFDALSTGEQLLLMIAFITTIIERLDPPLKVLAIDNAENLDAVNLRRVLNGLATAGAGMDNIIFCGVMQINQAEFPGWRVWRLDGGIAND